MVHVTRYDYCKYNKNLLASFDSTIHISHAYFRRISIKTWLFVVASKIFFQIRHSNLEIEVLYFSYFFLIFSDFYLFCLIEKSLVFQLSTLFNDFSHKKLCLSPLFCQEHLKFYLY